MNCRITILILGLVPVALSRATLAESSGASARTAPIVAASAAGGMATLPVSGFETLARDDPMGLLKLARSRCRREIRDYRCLFTKKELVKGRMRGPTVLDVATRNEPFSVLMTMRTKSNVIKRALYVEGSRYDNQGRELMLVEPAGWRRLLVSVAEIPVNDQRILENNRTTIQHFGFMAILDELYEDCVTASAQDQLELSYDGRGRIDGRPTFVLTRRLPYQGERGQYPDALTVVHLDAEWLLPVSIDRYADPEQRSLLASYRVTRVTLNPGLDERDFRF